jgi:hypothetical protein
MRLAIIAATALTASTSLPAQDLATATPVAGDWHYSQAGDGSEASFSTSAGNVQLWVHCMRATRRISLARPSSVAAPFLNVWSSSAERSLPSGFTPATGRLTVDLSAYDQLLDGLANSRGRIAVGISGQTSLVMPAWPEIARVIEDCRS